MITYIRDEKNIKRWRRGQRECGKLPKLHELSISNSMWQKVPFVDGVFYLFSAHFDPRPSHESLRGKVRVMAGFHVGLRLIIV